MGKPAKRAFDAQVFLARVGEGKSILQFKKGQNVFVQGDPADAVFYIQKGKIKLIVLSDHGKEAVVTIFGARPVLWRRLRHRRRVCRKVVGIGPSRVIRRGRPLGRTCGGRPGKNFLT